MDETVWVVITTFLGTIVVGMLIPIMTGSFVRRSAYDKIEAKLEREQELSAIKSERIEEKNKAIGLLEHQRDMLETKADIADDVLKAIRSAVQGGAKG